MLKSYSLIRKLPLEYQLEGKQLPEVDAKALVRISNLHQRLWYSNKS
jgi:hypothetical protein